MIIKIGDVFKKSQIFKMYQSVMPEPAEIFKMHQSVMPEPVSQLGGLSHCTLKITAERGRKTHKSSMVVPPGFSYIATQTWPHNTDNFMQTVFTLADTSFTGQLHARTNEYQP